MYKMGPLRVTSLIFYYENNVFIIPMQSLLLGLSGYTPCNDLSPQFQLIEEKENPYPHK